MAGLSMSLIAAFLFVSVGAAMAWSTDICRGIPGAYHLSCYTSAMAELTVSAKTECFEAYKSVSGCNYQVVETGKIYGCGFAINYAFETQECHDGYQAQEKTNEDCKAYISSGLKDAANRMNSTAPSNDMMCDGTQGPCPSDKSAGYFHFSCYTDSNDDVMVAEAKSECINSFLQSDAGKGCVPVPSVNDIVDLAGQDYYKCGTYIGYGFTTQACLDAYQAQEKTNTGCTKYIEYGLGDSANRMTAATSSSYMCPAQETNICLSIPGSYHLSCYTSDVSNVPEAKQQCFDSYQASNKQCGMYIVDSGKDMYGCGSYIIYAFSTKECHAGYQGQEKTNSACQIYKDGGLADSANRMTSTAPVGDSYDCPGTKGECAEEPGSPAGAYHFSCYAANLTADRVAEAKKDCIDSFLKSNSTCMAVPPTSGLTELTGANFFNCGTYISYGFTSQDCLDAYQAQEKTNVGCTKYNEYELGKSWNRNTANVPSSFQCDAVAPNAICDGIPGSYHLSCYTYGLRAHVDSAKTECFEAYIKGAPECSYFIVESGSASAPNDDSYGCGTYIKYAFNTEACLRGYQAQEKTNSACKLYVSQGLGDKNNRMATISTVATDSYDCPGTMGPCTETPNTPAGSYHFSCYAANLTAEKVADAKENCIESFLTSNPTCVPVPPADDITAGTNYFGCGTYIGYGFTTKECLDAYQAQEKTNTGCTKYREYGLGESWNRNTATTASSYQCEAVPKLELCDGIPGSYHLSCYTYALRAVVDSAKTECFEAYIKDAPECAYYLVESGKTETPNDDSYGCGTYIKYAFNTEACLRGYQAQEKTNSACTLYASQGLGEKDNRMTSISTVATDSYDCPGTIGPCSEIAGSSAGTYHFSCYAANLTKANVAAAKDNCIRSFLSVNTNCVAVPPSNALVLYTGSNYFGCGTYIGYGFTTKTCLDAYQAQEKTNTGCTKYREYGLGESWHRNTATTASTYMCDAVPARKSLRKLMFL